MLKISVTGILIFSAAYLAVCALLYFMQRNLLYFPTLPVSSKDAEAIMFENDNETLKIWHLRGTGTKALIYFGGNAEDVALNIPQFRRLFPEYHVYLHNYRGYGGSSGKPTEKALFSDACVLYDMVAQHHTDIAIMGRSLGTGVAVYLASQRPVNRLALITPYDSMTNVAADHYPFFPVTFLLHDRYDSLERAGKLTAETLILIAQHDEVIPRKRTDALIAALMNEVTIVEVIDATDHNTIGSAVTYEKALSSFFANNQLTASPH